MLCKDLKTAVSFTSTVCSLLSGTQNLLDDDYLIVNVRVKDRTIILH